MTVAQQLHGNTETGSKGTRSFPETDVADTKEGLLKTPENGRSVMKSRERQRANRKFKEEMLKDKESKKEISNKMTGIIPLKDYTEQ